MQQNKIDQINSGIRQILAIPKVYDFFALAIGGFHVRHIFVSQYIQPFSGAKILDIGCGTATLLESLPKEIDYSGYDLSEEYIESARKKYGDRGRFFSQRASAVAVDRPGQYDIVIASGILHHLGDEESQDLFKTAEAALKPGGHLACLDGVYHPHQSWLARYMVSQDRGQHVRTKDEYQRLAMKVFPHVEAVIYDKLLRIPYSHVMMKCVKASHSY